MYEYDSDTNNLKIDNTSDQNMRYYGSDPNNYVLFNNELWRIIGVFGNNVKLVRKDSLGNLSWDSSESNVNGGLGINQWGESTDADGNEYAGADLQVYLNKMYYGGYTTITCYGSANNGTKTCPKNSKGNFLTIDGTSKSLIDNHTWNTGAVETTKKADTLAFYNAERGTKTGKICTSGDYCNDTVTRKTEWTGYVALPYVTDWAYASSESTCETDMYVRDSSNSYACKNNNWMHWSSWLWYMSPSTLSAHFSWAIYVVGYNNSSYTAGGYSVKPSIYLKSNVLIESGAGTSNNPYILKLGE